MELFRWLHQTSFYPGKPFIALQSSSSCFLLLHSLIHFKKHFHCLKFFFFLFFFCSQRRTLSFKKSFEWKFEILQKQLEVFIIKKVQINKKFHIPNRFIGNVHKRRRMGGIQVEKTKELLRVSPFFREKSTMSFMNTPHNRFSFFENWFESVLSVKFSNISNLIIQNSIFQIKLNNQLDFLNFTLTVKTCNMNQNLPYIFGNIIQIIQTMKKVLNWSMKVCERRPRA